MANKLTRMITTAIRYCFYCFEFILSKWKFLLVAGLVCSILSLIYLRSPSWFLRINYVILSYVVIIVYSLFIAILKEQKLVKRSILSIFIPFVLLITDIYSTNNVSYMNIINCIYYYFILGMILTIFDIILLRKSVILSILRIVFDSFLFILYMLAVIILMYKIVTGNSINKYIIFAICQTSFFEAYHYFFNKLYGVYILGISIPLLILIIIIYVIFRVKTFRHVQVNIAQQKNALGYSKIIIIRDTALFLCVLLLIVLGFIGNMHQNIFFRPTLWKIAMMPALYNDDLRTFTKMRETHLKSIQNNISQEKQKPLEGLYVLIIGESNNKHYNQSYGYKKMTTPFQSDLIQKGILFQFMNAYSCHVLTMRVLSALLTNKNQYLTHNLDTSSMVSLIDIANSYQFKTIWFSNQERIGISSNFTDALSSFADYSFYIPRDIKNQTPCDGELLPYIQQYSFEGNSLVIIHLNGSHYPYKLTYPSDYLPDTSFSSYELSIRYNDDVLAQLFHFFQNKNATMIMYVSDHSEEISMGLCHDAREGFFRHEMIEIPCWVYFSDQYREKHPEKIRKIQQSLHIPFTNDLVFDFFVDIMEMNGDFRDNRLVFYSDQYLLKNGTRPLSLFGAYDILSKERKADNNEFDF